MGAQRRLSVGESLLVVGLGRRDGIGIGIGIRRGLGGDWEGGWKVRGGAEAREGGPGDGVRVTVVGGYLVGG